MYSEVSSKKTNINSSDNQILKAIQDLKESNIKYENNINEKIEELMKKEKTNGERIEELELTLNRKIEQECAGITVANNTKIDELENKINVKIITMEENITDIQKDMVQVFVDCHNSVNEKNKITVDQVTKIVGAIIRRDTS